MTRLSRRKLLTTGAAALGGGAALNAQARSQAPGVNTGTQTGRTFRGIVRHGTTIDVQELARQRRVRQ